MKNFKTGLLILFAIIIIILVFFLVKNIGNNSNTKQNDKLTSEIKYLDNKLTFLLNSMNNIKLDNYKVSVTKTSTSSKEQNGQQEGGSESNTSSSSSNSGSDKESNSNQSSKKTTSNEALEQYSLKEDRILTKQEDIDWTTIKNDIETLYSIIPTMTLDLYSNNINQEDILNFNKELDELTTLVKEENKEKTLIKLANLYRYLPAYASNFSDDIKYKSFLETKSNVFNSYVFANVDDWDQVNSYTRKAIESYSNILNNLNDNNNNYDTNKVYIVLNELQSASDIRDKDVFFIKYKNFLEESEKQNI